MSSSKTNPMQVCLCGKHASSRGSGSLQGILDLQILVTDPKYQRQGAGSMLVKWGCDKADELGIIGTLTASKAGLKTYLKHDFEIVCFR